VFVLLFQVSQGSRYDQAQVYKIGVLVRTPSDRVITSSGSQLQCYHTNRFFRFPLFFNIVDGIFNYIYLTKLTFLIMPIILN
jgi:hypothetical protein